MLKVAFFTRTDLHNSNPGDMLLGDGIRYLLKQAYGDFITVDCSCFGQDEDMLEFIGDYCDLAIIAGRPRLNPDCKDYQIFGFWKDIQILKEKGVKIFDLWGGSGFGCDYMNIAQYLNITSPILKQEVQYEKDIPDLIICRDEVMSEYLIKYGVDSKKVFQFPCSSYWAKDYYGVTSKEKDIDLVITHRKLPSNEWILNHFPKDAYHLGHNKNEYYWVDGKFDMQIVNNTRELLEVYSRAKKVVSLRLHGAIPALSFGAEVLYLGMDSRRYVLKSFGDKKLYNFFILQEKNIFQLDGWINNKEFDADMYEQKIVEVLRSFI